MHGLILFFIILFGLLLIGAILLQPGTKGGGLGAAFGGGGANSAFGAQGAAPFLAKLTYWLAAVFLGGTLLIEILIIKENRSVLEKGSETKPAAASAPTKPAPQKSAPAPGTPAQNPPANPQPAKK